jgi:hypothetical protein
MVWGASEYGDIERLPEVAPGRTDEDDVIKSPTRSRTHTSVDQRSTRARWIDIARGAGRRGVADVCGT